jgi:Zn finger protein HypA/HybF involved in hydrogenase expression
MHNWCRCCGKFKETKLHEDIPFCAVCVRKINAGKTFSIEKIKELQNIKMGVR